MNKLKVISAILTLVLIPFIISLIANFTTWFGTKANIEVTLSLDGQITVGSLETSEVSDLALTFKGEQIKNLVKLSWRVENTGSKGISSFEYGPLLNYPESTIIVDTRIANFSPLLNIGKKPEINTSDNQISVVDLGIFNKQDFFVIDVYVRDLSESRLSQQFFDNWNLAAKALDLKVKKESVSISSEKDKSTSLDEFSYYFGAVAGVFAAFFTIFLFRKISPNTFQSAMQAVMIKNNTQQ